MGEKAGLDRDGRGGGAHPGAACQARQAVGRGACRGAVARLLGLSYTIEYADEKGKFDEIVEDKGVTILVDPKAVMFILGTEMDYVEEKLQSGFTFRNPNEKGPLRLRRILPRLTGVKLFQIEEPDGAPADPDAPGAAIGIDAGGALAEVAVAVGGNAIVLDDREGFELALPVPAAGGGRAWQELFEGARLRAERALAAPGDACRHRARRAARCRGRAVCSGGGEAAGLDVLRIVAQARPGRWSIPGAGGGDARRGFGAAARADPPGPG